MAVILGILLGFLRYSLPRFLKRNFIINLILDAPKFPPPIAWIPFVILFFGIGNTASFIIVFIGVLPSIVTQVYDGLESIKLEVLQTARSMQLSKMKMLRFILIPAILPQLMTGIRVGFSMGWMSIIAAEMISGQSGLGYSIQINRINLQYTNMIYDMIAIGVIGYLMTRLLYLLEARMAPWK
ncbi:ABC transporter permease [Bacteriovorax stolpii]|uniref:ABC transporter permease n=1 Tax=Bacteriovorax stolpii TaxID=960 RepID=UPI00163CB2FA|nr:ABC transporter permease subunit [Bacteriovorax stolpii]